MGKDEDKVVIVMLDEESRQLIRSVLFWAVEEGFFTGTFKEFQRNVRLAQTSLNNGFSAHKSDAIASLKRLKQNAALKRRERFMTPEKFN